MGHKRNGATRREEIQARKRRRLGNEYLGGVSKTPWKRLEHSKINHADLQNWARPDVPYATLQRQEHMYMEVVDVRTDFVRPSHYEHGVAVRQPGDDQVPLLRVFGVNKQGNSVCANVWNFHPFMYAELSEQENIREVAETIHYELEEALFGMQPEWKQEMALRISEKEEQDGGADVPLEGESKYIPHGVRKKQSSKHVVSVEPVFKEAIETDRKKPKWFLKITLRSPFDIEKTRKQIVEGSLPSSHLLSKQTFESRVKTEQRFMVEHGLAGAGWVRIPMNRCLFSGDDTRCQIELHTDCDALEALDAFDPSNKGLYEMKSRKRVVSYDIEVKPPKSGRFPEAEKGHPVIQIAATSWEIDNPEPIAQVLFTLDSCGEIPGWRVVQCSDERMLLNSWGVFLQAHDPDICVGYNNRNFDVNYLWLRAKATNAEHYLYSGRTIANCATRKEDKRQSRNTGNRDAHEVTFDGRVEYDLMVYIKKNKKLRYYGLGAVSQEFLGDQKADMSYNRIPYLQEGTIHDRTRLGKYTCKDVLLPKQLILKLQPFGLLQDLSRVHHVRMCDIQTQGSTMLTYTRVLRKARERNYIVPHDENLVKEDYEGATVFESRGAFYDRPVAVLDFSALYPSIMTAHNNGPSTYIRNDKEAEQYNKKDINTCPLGNRYLNTRVRKSVLSSVLEDILQKRKEAKANMAKAGDNGEKALKAVYDGRQLALKVAANSVYGFTGIMNNGIYWNYASASTTAFGRKMIGAVKEAIEKKFTRANGYPGDAKVIYGDTDSVMIDFGIPIRGNKLFVSRGIYTEAAKEAIATSFKLAKEAADLCNDPGNGILYPPNKLEIENVYLPYILCKDVKKRYAGVFWENADDWERIKIRGLETVRRDNPPFVAEAQKKVLEALLLEGDRDLAVKIVKDSMLELRNGEMSLSKYIMTKELKKRFHEYGSNMPHAYLDKKMGQRFNIGDRIPYIIVQNGYDKHENAPNYKRAYYPIEVLNKNLQPDIKYYGERLISAMKRIFYTVWGEKEGERLLNEGEHMKKLMKRTEIVFDDDFGSNKQIAGGSSSNAKGLGGAYKSSGIIKFVYKKSQCVGCGVLIKTKETNQRKMPRLCDWCLHERPVEIYLEQMQKMRNLQNKHSRMWTECQNCQSRYISELDCESMHCPIFFERTNVARRLDKARTIMNSPTWDF